MSLSPCELRGSERRFSEGQHWRQFAQSFNLALVRYRSSWNISVEWRKLVTMRKSIWICIVVAVAIAAISLGFMRKKTSKLSRSIPNPCLHDVQLRTYAQWRQTVTFPYLGPEAKLQRVRDNYDKVQVGASKGEVLNAFGSPDFEEELAPKEPNRPCLGNSFVYYFQKPEETNNELEDKRIEVFLTPDGKVKSIFGNIGSTDKGGHVSDH